MQILQVTLCFVSLYMCACAEENKTEDEEASSRSYGVNMDRLGFFEVPGYLLKDYKELKTIHLSANKIRYIRKNDFPKEAVQNLRYINLRNNYIEEIDEDAFSHMPNLLIVDLSNNKLEKVPTLKAPNITKIFLRKNQIQSVSSESMRHLKNLKHFEIQENQVRTLKANTFKYNKELIYLDVSKNPLEEIEEQGLVGPDSLKYLILKNTLISKIPSTGIGQLVRLDIFNVPKMFTIPSASLFKNLKNIEVTYSMHCCPFRQPIQTVEHTYSNDTIPCNQTIPTEEESFETTTEEPMKEGNDTTGEDEYDPFENMFGDGFDNEFLQGVIDMMDGDNKDLCLVDEDEIEEIFDEVEQKFHVDCKPAPDAFNPCQDVMGTNLLRAFSWIIATFAIIGNVFQLVILFHSKQKSVYKLLMYNLGISNLLMGVYLLVLCCVDAYTFGEYYNFVQAWQYNGGCQAFGFLAVFATSLSVCSLVLITVERFLLIIFALQAGNQMQYRHAKYCVIASWLYSTFVAILPSTGLISSYSKTAICLPMDVYETVSEGYVVRLLVISYLTTFTSKFREDPQGKCVFQDVDIKVQVWLLVAYLLAFLLISYCYIRMYRNIKDVRPVSTNNTIDTKVAKRMALIIFSNFLCWLPISFAGLLAAYSGILFDVAIAKFLIVFIFPLNACTNPFLYAIFTKVFRDDTISLLNMIGLCRESPNRNDNLEKRERLPSYFKNKKKRADTATRTYMHVQAPSEGCTFINERHVEAETDFGSPNTPLRVMMESDNGKNNHLYDEVRPGRSGSTRGLLEDYKRRNDIPCSESTETASTAMSLRSAIDVEDNFSNMVGSVTNAEQSVLNR